MDAKNKQNMGDVIGDIFHRTGNKVKASFGNTASGILTSETFREPVTEYSSEIVSNEIVSVVDHIKENTAPIIEERAQAVSKDGLNTWERIREKIAPEGGFFKTIFARLVWIGAKISSFAGALFVDSWTGRDEKNTNTPHIETIISSFIGSLF